MLFVVVCLIVYLIFICLFCFFFMVILAEKVKKYVNNGSLCCFCFCFCFCCCVLSILLVFFVRRFVCLFLLLGVERGGFFFFGGGGCICMCDMCCLWTKVRWVS